MVKNEVHFKINGFDESLIVLEDYDYAYRASRQGKFGMIRSCLLTFSSRRLEKDGARKVLGQWITMGWYSFWGRKQALKKIKYEFGKYKK